MAASQYDLQNKIRYTFHYPEILKEAQTRRAFHNENPETEFMDPLATLGDAVLDTIHRATILREAPAEGKLVYELDPQHRATREYNALSLYVIKYS